MKVIQTKMCVAYENVKGEFLIPIILDQIYKVSMSDRFSVLYHTHCLEGEGVLES